jgi:hypothetical protein
MRMPVDASGLLCCTVLDICNQKTTVSNDSWLDKLGCFFSLANCGYSHILLYGTCILNYIREIKNCMVN